MLHSTNIAIANKCASTSHVHAKLRKCDKVNMKTSSTPNELADSAKKTPGVCLSSKRNIKVKRNESYLYWLS